MRYCYFSYRVYVASKYYGRKMHLDMVICDLESQMAAAIKAESAEAVHDILEAELATIKMSSRWQSQLGQQVNLQIATGEIISGTLRKCSDNWVILDKNYVQTLIPAPAIQMIWPLGRPLPEGGSIPRKLPLTAVLRHLARNTCRIQIQNLSGTISGYISSVGADYLELTSDEGTKPNIAIMLSSILLIRMA